MKYGIMYKNQILRVKTVNGKQTLSTNPQDALFLIDNVRMVEEARKSSGNGSLYSPLNSYPQSQTQTVKVKTEMVVVSTSPVVLVDPAKVLVA